MNFLKAGILPYYSKTTFLNDLEIDIYEKSENPTIQLQDDPWKKWVFQIESGGEFQKEESQNEYSLRTEIRSDKITDTWKTRMEASYEIKRENYFDEGEQFTNKQDEKQNCLNDGNLQQLMKSAEKWVSGLHLDQPLITWSTNVFENFTRKLLFCICYLLPKSNKRKRFHMGSGHQNTSIPLLIVGSAVAGLSYGAVFSLFPTTTAEFFGMKNLGVNYGLIFTGWGVAGVIGPMLGGMVADKTNSYSIGYLVAGVFLVIATVLVSTMKTPKVKA